MSDDVVTLHSLAASVARVEEVLAADKKERQEERAADKREIDEKLAAFIDEIRGIKDMMNKAEEEKAKAKKEREDAEARMWQGLMSLFSWTRMKAD